MIALIASFAFAHGGEDHAAPPPSVASADATTSSVAASSPQFEAVLRVNRGPAGAPVATTLLLADFQTSAPIVGATPSMALQGPATLAAPFTPTTPGTYAGTATFPAHGAYDGALVITTATASDLLAITGLRVGEPAPTPSGGTKAKLLGALGGVLLLGVGALVSLGIGYALGRTRGSGVAAVVLAMAATARHVSAHGGEDHGGEDHGGAAAGTANIADPTGSLHLRMESQFLVGLRTQTLARAPFQERVPALGRFVARAGGSATLRAPVSGELVAPQGGFPSPGSVVHAGQVLGAIRDAVGSADRASLAESRQQAANAVAEAKKAVTLGERDAAQLARLTDGVSDRERLERQQSLDVSRAALAEAERALAAIGEGASLPVRAPVDGRLGTALARPGDQVQAGDALFRVIDASGLWLEARVSERLAAGVTAGAGANVFAAAFPDKTLAATILDAGQEADPATGMFTVTLAVDPAGLNLHPGMAATAWLAAGPARGALVLPDAAAVDSNGLSLGFVKVGPEQFELRELKLGARSGDAWEVLSGLKSGERVVTDGTYTLRSIAGR